MKTKRILSMLLVIAMMISFVSVTTVQAFAATDDIATTSYEGSGTESDPYIANTASELFGFVHSDKNMYIRLGADMTLSGGLYVEANINIDINGKELNIKTNSSGIYIDNTGKLTITGSGKIKYEGDSAFLSVYGTFESNGPVIYESKEVGMGVVAMYNYSKVYIYDGVFKGDRFFNHDQGKLYIYGGEFEENVHTDKFAVTYVYGGNFLDTLTNWGSTCIFDGEFAEPVSTYKYDNTGNLILVNGHFKKGVTIGENANYKLADTALCYSHNTRTAANFLYTNEEITVFSPYFETQNPAVPYGKTEFDAGEIYEEIEDYVYGFKAKDVPKVFADMDFAIEEKIVVKNSTGKVSYTQTETGKYAKGVGVEMNTLSADDYVIENTINLYYNGEVRKSATNTVKVKVKPLSNSDYGFKTITPSLSEAELSELYTDLGTMYFGQSLKFGFTSQISQELSDKGYNVKEKVYVNYNNQGTLATRNTGKEFDIKSYVDRLGKYEVWCIVQLYKGDEYVTGKTHIFKIAVAELQEVSVLKANVTKPVAGALPDATVTPAGEGYKTTDVDWSYYDETAGDYYIMPEGMTFEAGKTYECAVQFDALDEYTFPENKGYIAGYINGYKGVISQVYSTTRAYVTVNFTVSDDSLKVIFTPDSKPEVGSKLTVDIERMAELDDELMEAYLDDAVTYKWFYDGRLQTTTKNNSYEIKNSMLGHYIAVKVVCGDKNIVSDEFEIKAASSNVLLGDANLDNDITITDATTIQRHVAKLTTLTGDSLKAADVNKDSEVSIVDATTIQRFVAKIITEF
ncbi:MAG: dockerin type I repeat-containing protein [Ruminococcus sp.]|nr:dockerin type I repeat-containing protein [Ruminococcus sp.]